MEQGRAAGRGRVAVAWAALLAAALPACSSVTTAGRTRQSSSTTVAAPAPTSSATASAPTPPPGLTPEAMYSGTAPALAGVDPARLRVVVVTGDVIPVRLTHHALLRLGDWEYPFAATSSLLHSGDITIVDLEAPLIAHCPDVTTGFTFCADASTASTMAAAGVTVADVANNHFTNYGPSGTSESERHLAASGIAEAGLGHVAVRDVRGLRFAFVGLNLVGTHLDPAELQRLITTARGEADVVIVQFHWGREYETFPFSAPGLAPDDPRQVGRLAIDDGADLVIGNHPHCVQGAEIYKDHLITYAHGNFIFDQDWSVGTQEGVVGRYSFEDSRLVAVQYVPVRIVDRLQPRPLDPATGEGRAVLDRMLRSSEELLGKSPPVLDGPGRNDACP